MAREAVSEGAGGPLVDAPSAARGGWRGVVFNQRVRPILITALVGFVIFTAFRAGLLLVRLGDVDGLSASQITGCFLIGARYDAMPIGYALLPMVLTLFLVSDSMLGGKWFRRSVAVYATVLTGVAVAVEIVGAAFFLHFGRRLDWMALSYPRHMREVGVYIWRNYPVLVLFPVTILILYGSYRFFRRVFWNGAQPTGNVWLRLGGGALLTGLCVLSARGGLDRRPLRFGPSFLSRNNLVNQLTLNNFFTFSQAVKSNINNGRDKRKLFPYPAIEKAREVTMRMLSQGHDRFAGSEGNPLWRRTHIPIPQQRYNVIVIIMEGMSGSPVGALGYVPSYTPVLDRLCREGMYFERMYAVGARTSRAMVAVLCGHPDLEGVSVLQQEQAQGRFLTLPDVLKERGYHTMFIYGGDSNFDNMKGFFRKGGIDEFIEEKDMHAEQLAGNWGVPDEIIFREAHERFLRMGEQPFFATILTVTNHSPYEVPSGRTPMLFGEDENTKRLNAYRYADWALGDFIRTARKADYFRRTIFVLVADHGHNLNTSRIMDVPGYRVPCLFYAPGILAPSRVSLVASQTDIPPTLLALLGGSYEHCFMGRNLLTLQGGEGFAMLHGGGSVGFVRSDRAMVLPPDQRKGMLFRTDLFTMESVEQADPNDSRRKELQLQMLSYYSIAEHLYFTKAYRRPMGGKYLAHGNGTPSP